MIDVSFDKNFTQGWVNNESGSGITSVSGGILKAIGTGNSPASRSLRIPVKKGSVVEVEVTVRVNKGEARLAIDGFTLSAATNVNYSFTKSKEWTRIKTSVVVPYSSTYDTISVVVGKWGAQNYDVDVEYRDLAVRISNGYGQPQVIAQGLIYSELGSASIRDSYRSFGINRIELIDGGMTLELFVDATLPNNVSFKTNPLIQCTGTMDNFLIPLAGGWSLTNNSFKVKLTDGTKFIPFSDKKLYFFYSVTI